MKRADRQLTILIDTREQEPLRFPLVFPHHTGEWDVFTKVQTLRVGDYQLDGHQVAYERKADYDELAGNIKTGKKGKPCPRSRFRRELLRARLYKRFALVVCAGSPDDPIYSLMPPEVFKRTLRGLMIEHGITDVWAGTRENAVQFILEDMIQYLVHEHDMAEERVRLEAQWSAFEPPKHEINQDPRMQFGFWQVEEKYEIKQDIGRMKAALIEALREEESDDEDHRWEND